MHTSKYLQKKRKGYRTVHINENPFYYRVVNSSIYIHGPSNIVETDKSKIFGVSYKTIYETEEDGCGLQVTPSNIKKWIEDNIDMFGVNK